ncbi:hypothetical protein J6590_055669 [Homalodisca vitripennis]|nr:hypothetical protein J6590_055669 [Homalodisca vitripennis]
MVRNSSSCTFNTNVVVGCGEGEGIDQSFIDYKHFLYALRLHDYIQPFLGRSKGEGRGCKATTWIPSHPPLIIIPPDSVGYIIYRRIKTPSITFNLFVINLDGRMLNPGADRSIAQTDATEDESDSVYTRATDSATTLTDIGIATEAMCLQRLRFANKWIYTMGISIYH